MPKVSAATRAVAESITLEQLKEILADVIEVGNDIHRSLRDGFQLTDIIAIGMSLAKLRKVGPQIRPAIAALNKQTAAERAELFAYLAAAFRLDGNKAAEERVRTFIRLVEKTYIFIFVGGVRIVEDWKLALKK